MGFWHDHTARADWELSEDKETGGGYWWVQRQIGQTLVEFGLNFVWNNALMGIKRYVWTQNNPHLFAKLTDIS